MSMDDQYSDSDRTIIRPRPGKKRLEPGQSGVGQAATPQHMPPPVTPQPPPAQPPVRPSGSPQQSGSGFSQTVSPFATSDASSVQPSFMQAPPATPSHGYAQPVRTDISIDNLQTNPLVSAATTLLALSGQLRDMLNCPDVEGLRARVIEGFKSFENNCHQAELPITVVKPAHYGLCTFIDEVVLSTPWGSESGWSNSSLLSTFHNETWGGERFFQVLNNMLQEPAKNLHYLEFSYLIIALGFEGKYGGLDQGMPKLEGVRTNLFATIRQLRGDYERELSPRWRGVEDKRNALMRTIPLWVLASLSALLLLAIFLSYRYLLNETSSPVYESLNKIGRYHIDKPESDSLSITPPVDENRPTLIELLQSDIEAGELTVKQWQNQEIIRIQGDLLFRSGKVKINPKHEQLLHRIAAALNQLPGQVLIIGHSDNVPIRSLKWQSNWDLSRARAANVLDLISFTIDNPSRLTPDGRADTEPLVPNNTPANRARNRRVEIVLLTTNTL